MSRAVTRRIVACVVALLAGAAHAAGQPPQDQQPVWDAAMQAASKGPADVPLLDQAVLHLPAAEVFVPQPHADRLLALFGNPGGNPEMVGIILPRRPDADWTMPVVFHKVGHVDDAAAQTWDTEAMLAGYRAGTADQNAERARAGQPTVQVLGWVERPHYDPSLRRLEWAMNSRLSNAAPNAPPNINFNTYVLGREGYFRLDLVSSMTDLDLMKAVAERQLEAIEFSPGKRYTDFDARSDRVASQGLGALVVGESGQRGDNVDGAIASVAKYVLPAVVVLAVAVGFVLLRRRKAAPGDPV